MAKQKNQEAETDNNSFSKSILKTFIDKYEKDIWNRVDGVITKVSMGSLALDQEISLTQGIHRFCGISGSGKSSEAAEVCRNFLKTYPNAKVIWIKAEGRLSDNLKIRSGVKFVSKEEEWDYGTALVFECNAIEIICEFLDTIFALLEKTKDRLLFVVDSVDGLRLKSNDGNPIGKEKMAGVPFYLKRYLQRSYIPMDKYGVIGIFISQVTADVAKDDYAAPPLTSGGGGNALLHWSNYILEFGARFTGDEMYKDGPLTKFDEIKNPKVGHQVRVKIKKTDKENEKGNIFYPIKHGETGGQSIWKEHEVIIIGQEWKKIAKGGAWYEICEEWVKDIKEKLGLDVEPKHQGFNNFVKYLEANKEITNYLFERLRFVISK